MTSRAHSDWCYQAVKLCLRLRTIVVWFAAVGFLPVCNVTTFAAEEIASRCVLVERQGKVEIARKGSAAWTMAKADDVLQVGDRIRTGLRARATLRWSELAVIRVDELTSLELQPPAKPEIGRAHV